MTVPEPRTPGRYRIALICLGNICRSPMADVVLEDRIRGVGLDQQVDVVSAGTGDWHVGEPMDARAAALLAEEGYDTSRHRAQQVVAAWIEEYDLLLAMDATNLGDLRALDQTGGATADGRLRLFRDFDPIRPGSDVPDPYFGGEAGFRDVLTMVERTSEVLAREIADALAL
ncbi:low molecular weight protein-tyrosine-phosphatase [Nocardioides sambongensis]|uniref:low molecular weight protein-tyrosine-phosphatase n=1 Tax=Nocardioides sambongensis TaxID=2589074 RepID=UPI00112B1943|nr:low molecular weight protein-tyrosine-phosphatase [Nocardioides sambongensis]